jgi:hypothetical protein
VKLEVLAYGKKNGKAYNLYLCHCGTKFDSFETSVNQGRTVSCGCVKLQNTTKHGKFGTRIYSIWSQMKDRCFNPKNIAWHRYGGRGITVCERWLKFENFYEDVGDPPPGKKLDRKNNDGNYEPGNWKWSTDQEQASNRSTNRWLTFDNRTQTMMQWAIERKMSYAILQRRLKQGMSVEEAMK